MTGVTAKENPFDAPIRAALDFDTVTKLLGSAGTFVPGLVLVMLQMLSGLVSVVLWPYGFVLVLADIGFQLIRWSWGEAERTASWMEATAHVISVLIYACLFGPIWVVALPAYGLLGLARLGAYLAGNPEIVAMLLGGIALLITIGIVVALVVQILMFVVKAIFVALVVAAIFGALLDGASGSK